MDTWAFLAFLFLFTMIAFMSWAWVSKRRTEQKLADPAAPKSSLATDGPGPNPVTAPRGDTYRARETDTAEPTVPQHPKIDLSSDTGR